MMLPAKRRGWLPFAFGMIALALAIILPFLLFGDRIEHWSGTRLSRDPSSISVFALGSALLAADPLLPVPSSAVATLLGARLGFIGGTAAIWVGMNIGLLVGLVVGRSAAGMRKVFPPEFERWIVKNGLVALLICRPVPVLAEMSLLLAGVIRRPLASTLAWLGAANGLLAALYAAAGSAGAASSAPATWITVAAIIIPAGFGSLALFLASTKRIPEPAADADRQTDGRSRSGCVIAASPSETE